MSQQTKIASLTLYHFPKSRSQRVLWALNEAGVENHTVIDLDVMAGEQYTPRFLALNPNHAVPVLVVTWSDGTEQTLYESTAIVLWIADFFSDAQLCPPARAPGPRADYLQMAHYAGTSFDSMLWQLRLHISLLGADSDEKTIDRYKAKIADEVEPVLLKRLEKSPWVLGDTFSAADIIVGHCVGWATLYDLCTTPPFRSYLKRLYSRAAFSAPHRQVPFSQSSN